MAAPDMRQDVLSSCPDRRVLMQVRLQVYDSEKQIHYLTPDCDIRMKG